MEREVRLVCSSNVVAAEYTAVPPVLLMSPLDHRMGYASYEKRTLFFKCAPTSSGSSFLKESLANTLVHFYPFAGRLSLCSNNVYMHLHCNNAGVTFLEAETQATLADLGEFLPSDFTEKLCQMEIVPEWPWRREYPLFTVQVTHFACGGLSMGICFSHQVCDGPSFWYFMNSWSEIARGGGGTLNVLPDTSFNIPVRSFGPGEMQHHLDKVGMGLFKREDLRRFVIDTSYRRNDKASVGKLKFTRQDLQALKSKAPGRTTFEVLSAYLWQRLAKSWRMSAAETAGLYIFVGTRHRLKSISKSYLGNAALPTAAVSTVGELEQISLPRLAERVHERVAVYTEDTTEGIVSYMYENFKNEGYIPMLGTSAAANVVITSSPRHPVYETDFGWGRPVGCTPGSQLGHNNVFLLPSAEAGAIEAIIALNKECMDVFVEDEEFVCLL